MKKIKLKDIIKLFNLKTDIIYISVLNENGNITDVYESTESYLTKGDTNIQKTLKEYGNKKVREVSGEEDKIRIII